MAEHGSLLFQMLAHYHWCRLTAKLSQSDARQHIEAALKRSVGNLKIEDVQRAVREGRAQLWPRQSATVVSEIGKDLNIWLAGGELKSVLAMQDDVQRWAKQQGCDRMTVQEARPGWARALKTLGYREVTILVKEI